MIFYKTSASYKVKQLLLNDLVVALLVFTLRNQIICQTKTCAQMFIAVIVITGTNQKPPKYP